MSVPSEKTLSLRAVGLPDFFSASREPLMFYLSDRVIKQSIDKTIQNVSVSSYGKNLLISYLPSRKGEQKRMAVLPKDEGISYLLGKVRLADGHTFTLGKHEFSLLELESSWQGEMVLDAYDWVSTITSSPIGIMFDPVSGRMLLIQQTDGRLTPGGKKQMTKEELREFEERKNRMTEAERLEFSLSAMRLLGSLHKNGFGCEGLPETGLIYFRGQAKLYNPLKVFAFDIDDPETHKKIYYEALASIAYLVREGFAGKGDMGKLSAAYLSESPAGRAAVAEKHGLARKEGSYMRAAYGTSKDALVEALSSAAERWLGHF